MTSNNQDYKRDFCKEEILFDKKILFDKNNCKTFCQKRIARKSSDTNTYEFQ